MTGETSNAKQVGFDAMRFTPTAEEPPPPPTGAGFSFPVGAAETGAGWHVTLPLGASWTASNGHKYWGHLAEDWSRDGGGQNLGQPVYAAAAGEVVVAKQNCGNYLDVIVIKHQVAGITEPIYTMYGHIVTTLTVGAHVQRRQQLGVLGDPITFGPHLHFEIKNNTALTNGPFSSCSDVARKVYVSAGYSGKRNDFAGGDYWDLTDAVVGNRYYAPSRFIRAHPAGAGTTAAASRAPMPMVKFSEGDGEPRCAPQE